MLIYLLALLLSPRSEAITTSPHAFRVESGQSGTVVLGADHAELEHGESRKMVVLLWGNLEIFGEVDEVVVLSGHVVFHDGSKLYKSLTVMGGSFDSEPGSQVAPENVFAKAPGPLWRMLTSFGSAWRDNIGWVAKLCASVVSAFILWLFGWAFFAGLPAIRALTADSLAPYWPKNLLLGLLGSVGVCVVFVMLLISIVGWLLIPFYVLFLLIAGVVSYSAACLWAGHRLLPPKPGKVINPAGLLLGCLALQFLWAVPVWWALLPVLLLWTLAWGACLRSLPRLWR
jgi:hypothetical protein